MIDVSAGICPLGPSKKVKAAVRKAVRNLDVYPDRDSSGLRKFFRSKFAVAEDGILFANSLKEILFLIGEMRRPRKVLVAGPAPDIYADAGRRYGAEVVHISATTELATDVESIRRNMEGADILFIASPNRISGKLTGENDLPDIIRAAADVLVVIDESLIEFTDSAGMLAEAARGDNLVVLRTTANYHGLPGLELAYAVSSPQLIAGLSLRKSCSVGMLAAEAAKTAYRDHAYRRLTKEFMQAEKHLMAKALKKLGKITFHESDANVFLIRAECRDKSVADALAGAGFCVADCGGIEGLGPDYLRLSIMKHDHNLKLLRILRERCL